MEISYHPQAVQSLELRIVKIWSFFAHVENPDGENLDVEWSFGDWGLGEGGLRGGKID